MGKFTLDEVLGKTDNVIAIAGDVRSLIEAAKKASADGKITPKEADKIRERAQALVDEVQAFADEVIADILD